MDSALDPARAAGTAPADRARAGTDRPGAPDRQPVQGYAPTPDPGDPYANLIGNWSIWKIG